MRECNCLETDEPRNGHTLCRQNATITHVVKFVPSFSIAHGGGNDVSRHVQSRKHHGIEQTMKKNSSIRPFFTPPLKTADSKAESITRHAL